VLETVEFLTVSLTFAIFDLPGSLLLVNIASLEFLILLAGGFHPGDFLFVHANSVSTPIVQVVIAL
jgi:hypothetical protein